MGLLKDVLNYRKISGNSEKPEVYRQQLLAFSQQKKLDQYTATLQSMFNSDPNVTLTPNEMKK